MKLREHREGPRPVRLTLSWPALLLLATVSCASGVPAATSTSSPGKPGGSLSAASPQSNASGQSTLASSAGDWRAQWDALQAAAKQEGHLALVSAPGDNIRQVFDEFQNKYGITIEQLAGNGEADLVPRISLERQAGQYNWDVGVHSQAMMYHGLKSLGAVDPLRPALILPEDTDDANWLGGFAAGWGDVEKLYDYAFVAQVRSHVYVNRAVIAESQLSSYDQLWDPVWKGKMVMQDPRVSSAGSAVVAAIVITRGEEKARAFLQQQPILSQDRRQVAELVVRGQNPVGAAVDLPTLELLSKQGLDVSSVRPLAPEDTSAVYLSASSGAIALINRAPHPNAAKLFVNWMLSQEGQAAYAKRTASNVRRTDVPVSDPRIAADPNKQYVRVDIEQNEPANQRAIAIARDVLK